jgi:CBS domain-containing protein
MRAKNLMVRKVLTVCEDEPADSVLDALVRHHIHGAPVVNREGDLVGMISQLDLHLGAMTRRAHGRPDRPEPPTSALKVGEIMTSPALSATEETPVVDLCKMMHRLRIHRVPIVRGRKVTGVVSSLDVCGAIGEGRKLF